MTQADPPRTPQQERDFLDWSENQARSRASNFWLDAVLIGMSLLFTALLVLTIFVWVHGWRR